MADPLNRPPQQAEPDRRPVEVRAVLVGHVGGGTAQQPARRASWTQPMPAPNATLTTVGLHRCTGLCITPPTRRWRRSCGSQDAEEFEQCDHDDRGEAHPRSPQQAHRLGFHLRRAQTSAKRQCADDPGLQLALRGERADLAFHRQLLRMVCEARSSVSARPPPVSLAMRMADTTSVTDCVGTLRSGFQVLLECHAEALLAQHQVEFLRQRRLGFADQLRHRRASG